VKKHSYPEPSAAVLSSTTNLEGFARYTNLANLSTPGAGEVDYATESGAELEGRRNRVHVKHFVA
jgi:hypothetical protein